MNLEKIKTGSKKAFTLIELLVVITIIGILATWAVSVYTSQIQKARDTTRITDVTALKAWIEQSYGDTQEYPTALTFNTSVPQYMWKLTLDQKQWQPCAKNWTINTNCGYAYKVADDTNWVIYQLYEVSTWLENWWNVTSKAATDKWNDTARLEMWASTNTIDQWLSAATATVIAKDTASLSWALLPAWTAATTGWEKSTVIIFWS